jgi:DNA-binding response OmpR family regulator
MDHINLSTGEIEYKGIKANLTRNELKIVDKLNRASGVVTYEEIYEAIFNIKPNVLRVKERKAITVHISRIRAKVPTLIILNRNGFGYELKRKVVNNG